MSVSTILVICYYNGTILRTETDVKYRGRKYVIMPFDVSVECMFEHLIDMIYSRTTIDKQIFKLVLNCKYPLKSGNRFQPFPISDDSSVYRMLNMVNTTTIEEIELYIEVVLVKPQGNQSVGGHIDLLVCDNYNVVEFDYGCGPSSGPVLDTIEKMKIGLMKKVMMNLMKMLMMNLIETRMFKLMDMYHHFRISTKFWRMSKRYVFAHAACYDV